jgi:predicted TIM-barrel fold metal-dependent hydrolase
MPPSAEEIIDVHTHVGVELYRYVRDEYPYCQDLRTLFTHADRTGVTRCVVFPCVSYQAMDLLQLRESKVVLNGHLDDVPYGRENRRLLKEIYEYFPQLALRTIPFVNLDPVRKVNEQIALLRKLREDFPFYGLKIQPFAIQSPIRSLMGDGAPFLDFAREHNLPFIIHSSIDAGDRFSQCADILAVAESNPDLRFCLAHSCRFHRPSLDRVALLPNTWFDCSAHGIHCELAARDHDVVAKRGERFEADYHNPGRVLNDLARSYPGKMMWGSDSPAHSYASSFGGTSLSLWSSYDLEMKYLREIDSEIRADVAWKNARAFLGGTVPGRKEP